MAKWYKNLYNPYPPPWWGMPPPWFNQPQQALPPPKRSKSQKEDKKMKGQLDNYFEVKKLLEDKAKEDKEKEKKPEKKFFDKLHNLFLMWAVFVLLGPPIGIGWSLLMLKLASLLR